MAHAPIQRSIPRRLPLLLVLTASLCACAALAAPDDALSPPDPDPDRERIMAIDALRARAVEKFTAEPKRIVLGERAVAMPAPRFDAAPAPTEDITHETLPPPGWPTSGWAPYSGDFGLDEAAHLLRRTIVGPRFDEIQQTAAMTPATAAAAVFETPPLPPLPGPWAVEPIPADVGDYTQEMIDSLLTVYQERQTLLVYWWSDRMLDVGSLPNARETMVHFWHDHFATSAETVIIPQSMFVQNDLFRRFAFGNFRELTRRIYKDPAMLIWLNGNQNTAGNINENFARELLELFTLGLDNYTQQDIIEAARAFTGWYTADGVSSQISLPLHDDGLKTFLGQTGRWHGDDIIDIIFEQEVTANFIATKLYQWFIDDYIDKQRAEELGAILRDNDYEMLPLLVAMMSSQRFHDPYFRGAKITDGFDKTIGVMRSLYQENLNLMDDPGGGAATWTAFSMTTFRHIPFYPPNVAGWPGYRTWVDSTTLPWRKTLDVAIVDGEIYGFDIEMEMDPLGFANRFSNPNDALLLVDEVALYLFGSSPTPLVRQAMIDELLQGAEPYDWSMADPEAPSRIQGLVRLAMRLPDFQLK